MGHQGTRLKRLALVAALVSFLVPNGSTAHGAVAPTVTNTNTPNVLFILLDEASMWSLLRTDGTINANRFPGFAALAQNSTWYRDTMTTAQWTYFAVPALLSGREASFDKGPTFEEWPRNIFTAFKGTLKMDVQEPVTGLCPRTLCRRPMQKNRLMAPSDHVLRMYDAIGRAANDPVPGLHFVHAVVPHHPWALTTEMRFSQNIEDDPRPGTIVDRKRDSYQSHLRQYTAVDAVVGDMIRTMKASPNWDDTMIVVTADHGLTFAPGSNIRDKVDPTKKYALDDVFRVPLFIKYPHQSTGAVSDCVASSMDILPTVLSATGARTGWKFDGVDLTKGCPKRVSRHVHWPKGETDVNSHFKDLLARVRFYDGWIDAEGTADDIARVGLSGSLVGTTVPAAAETDDRVQWKLHRAKDFRTIGFQRFSFVPGRATGNYRVLRTIGPRTEGLIVVDGVITGVVAELAGQKKSNAWNFFSSGQLTSALHPGSHVVEMWTATWVDGVAALRRVGPPTR